MPVYGKGMFPPGVHPMGDVVFSAVCFLQATLHDAQTFTTSHTHPRPFLQLKNTG